MPDLSRATVCLVLLIMATGCTVKPSPVTGTPSPVQATSQTPPSSSPVTPHRTIQHQGPLYALSEQGWSDDDAEWFYSITQGSQLVYLDWFVALEVADGQKSFLENISRFGYISRNRSGDNPQGLPVGFAKDEGTQRSWVGLTCAACHTGMVEHDGKSYVIDGAPGMGDLEGLLRSLEAALAATIVDGAKFDRFAKAVLGAGDSAVERDKLKEALQRIAGDRKAYNDRNLPSSPERRFGFGRVDAFGAILNEVTVRFLEIAMNRREASAPVSYPFLWDTPQHDFVQWNGSAPNAKGGSLARNVGEVLGVFGGLEIPDSPPAVGYASTVQIHNLLDIESRIANLKSPLWPREFKSLDAAAIQRGRTVFVQVCAACHALDFKRDDPNRHITANMQDIGTDPQMSKNVRTRIALTGRLEGSKLNFIPIGPVFAAQASGEAILIHEVVGTILGSWKAAPPDRLEDLKMRAPLLKAAGLDKYKGRPLNGIWATAPYLHNGSVPTLRDLLKPQKNRPATFWVGSRKFNPQDVGFEIAEADGEFKFDTSVPGNFNVGHEYGTGVKPEDGGDGKTMTAAEVEDLLEFLRSQ